MAENKMTVRDFIIKLAAKERTKLLRSAPIKITMSKNLPNHRDTILITEAERDEDAFAMHVGICYLGFGKLMPNAADSVVLNDPATKDKSFKFEWV